MCPYMTSDFHCKVGYGHCNESQRREKCMHKENFVKCVFFQDARKAGK